MNKFEQHIKTSLENYNADYNPAHWEDIQNRLNKSGAGKSSYSAGKITGIAAGVIAAAGLIYFFMQGNSSSPEKSNAEKVISQNADINKVKENAAQQETPAENKNQTAALNNSENKNSVKEKNIPAETKTQEEKTTAAENTSDKTNPENIQAKQEPSPVLVTSSFNATFHFNQPTACAGTAVQFIADNAASSCAFRWDFGDGRTSAEKSPSHVYAKAGNYTVKLKLTDSKQNLSDEKQLALPVNPVPYVEIDFTSSENNPSEINFEAKGNTISEYVWNFDDKQTSSEKNPVHNYMKKGTYQVTLTAKNSFGCTAADKRNVTIENLFPLAPDAFSPNGDRLNDTWMPASLQNGDFNFTLTVFDKNMNTVFKTSNKNDSWDGSGAKTGERFTWKLIVKNKNGKETSYTGFILIAE
ncbi:MAG: PKD domain-containing protein [Bacteroidetes bacterium]|nr:PKD domain-containing protein [Bacteroidota bacterium]